MEFLAICEGGGIGIDFNTMFGSTPFPGDMIAKVHSNVAFARVVCEGLELDASVNRCNFFERFLKTAEPTFQGLSTRAKTLREAIESELPLRSFVYIPVDESKLLNSMNKDWGDIWSRYQDVQADSVEATYCYALRRYAASIFHESVPPIVES